MRRAALTAAFVLAILAGAVLAGPASDFDSDETTGYRVQNYRAPVSRPVEGGERIDLPALDRLRDEGAVLIDTMPQRGGTDPATGAWRLVDRRETIPGATWLPETGRGRLEPRLSAYFAHHLARLTGGDRGRAIVFFCLADCWMSWNAVKRAAALGYTRLYWFADGTDGWAEAERPLVEAVPPPVPPLEDR